MALSIASVYPVRIGWAPKNEAEYESNARLIAAAPELLAALKAALNILDPANQYSDPYFSDHQSPKSATARQMRAAIAKAEGR